MVFQKFYNEPPVNKKEVLRYAGCRGTVPENIDALADDCMKECKNSLSYRICYTECPVNFSDGTIDFGFAKVESANLLKNLDGCSSAVIFAATVGLNMDRLISKYSKVSPSRSLVFQALGAERVEALCDLFNEEIKKEALENGFLTCPRFSPGYGDLPLAFQRDIFKILDCERKIGVTLGENLLMSPSKSVTAIIGKKKK